MRQPQAFLPPNAQTLTPILTRRHTNAYRTIRTQTNIHTTSRPQTCKRPAATLTDSQCIRTATLEKLRHSRLLSRTIWADAIIRTKLHTAVDATAGRGTDSLELARLLGPDGTVHALDIQEAAVMETRERYTTACAETSGLAMLHVHCANHDDLGFLELPDASVGCVVYNLGWYPGVGADRSVVTVGASTVRSLQSAEGLVGVGGVISVMVYVGHAEGREEERAVMEWAGSLCVKTWSCSCISYPNRASAPGLMLAERLQ